MGKQEWPFPGLGGQEGAFCGRCTRAERWWQGPSSPGRHATSHNVKRLANARFSGPRICVLTAGQILTRSQGGEPSEPDPSACAHTPGVLFKPGSDSRGLGRPENPHPRQLPGGGPCSAVDLVFSTERWKKSNLIGSVELVQRSCVFPGRAGLLGLLSHGEGKNNSEQHSRTRAASGGVADGDPGPSGTRCPWKIFSQSSVCSPPGFAFSPVSIACSQRKHLRGRSKSSQHQQEARKGFQARGCVCLTQAVS